MRLRTLGSAILIAWVTTACTSSSDTDTSTESQLSLETVETLSEDVANRLIEFSDAIRRRDFDAAGEYLHPSFQGTPFGERTGTLTTLPGGVTRKLVAIEDSVTVNRDGFIADLEELIQPFSRVDYVYFKTRGAEFDADARRGSLRLTTHVLGIAADGDPVSVYAWGTGEASRADEESPWLLAAYTLERYQATGRPQPMLTDVATSAGVAVTSPRLGKEGNRQFYWRGAATGDIDGDGRDDLFTSTHDRLYLYRNRGDGTFEDRIEQSGIDAPAGVTGPLFFDYDNDGDVDLFLGYVGWLVDGAPGGDSLRLFQNDGTGRFTDVTADLGLTGQYVCAFSPVAADFDNDGWLDLYICAYERLDAVYPNSWYRATNGNPNLLLLNQGGKEFVDSASAAGVAGTAWSYAAAAADFDGDGDQDLYVANDYGDNNLFVNRGDGTFEDRATELGVLDTGNGMGAAWGDTDADGQLDLYVSNMSSSAGNRILKRLAQESSGEVESTLYKLAAGNSLFRQKDGRFVEHARDAGGLGASWAWSVSFLDLDLDGVQDLYVANGFISGDSLKDT